MGVTSAADTGAIYFRAGEVVHAESNTLQGEEAFYWILSWELGIFACDESRPEKETIEGSWDFLLMESLRRLETVRNR
jgi:hypothetical protein